MQEVSPVAADSDATLFPPPGAGRAVASGTALALPASGKRKTGAAPDAIVLRLQGRARKGLHASKRLRTIDALVPPKPNEFDSTQPTATLSQRSRTIGMSANSGSRFSILALSQMKPLFIISSE